MASDGPRSRTMLRRPFVYFRGIRTLKIYYKIHSKNMIENESAAQLKRHPNVPRPRGNNHACLVEQFAFVEWWYNMYVLQGQS